MTCYDMEAGRGDEERVWHFDVRDSSIAVTSARTWECSDSTF